jgi:predicted transcriptional regulator
MKAVMISIRPEWCEKIASGEKTVEVRKTRPKIEPPFKCYIYCTVGDGAKGDILPNSGVTCGKVIGEFVCHWIRRESEVALGLVDVVLAKTSCMGYRQIMDYADGGDLHTWNISDLVIYDKPKRLSEFYSEGDCDCMNCRKCAWFDAGNGYNVEADCNLAYKGIGEKKTYKPIIRPPQSWCYVEEVTT